MSSTYMVVLNEPNDAAWQTIKETWDHYILDKRVAFVVVPNGDTANDIVTPLGMNGEGRVLGMVVNIGSGLSGYNKNELVDWTRKRWQE